jgi:two-component system sensor histidine kinase PilS (NtrC family)
MHATPSAGVPVSFSASGPDTRSLPRQRALLSWLFGARTALAVGTLLIAALQWTRTPDVSFILSIAVLLTLVATAYGWWRTRIRGGDISVMFLLGQALADLALVTTLVHYASAPALFASLFVLVIAGYAILLPQRWGALVAVLATGLYVADTVLGGSSVVDVAFWVQVLLFNLVFAIVASLGDRLRRADVDQVTLEYELRRVRLEADEILQNIRSGVITVDAEGRLAFINPTAERLLGIDGDRLLGRPILDKLQVQSKDLGSAIVAGLRQGRKVSRGEGVVRANGRVFPIGLSTTTFQPEDREAPSVTAIFTDISELKQLQELHARAERLEAVAALSASLAHEIRNPLASIRSSCEQLARGKHASEDDQVLAGLIVRESDRLSRLLSEFLDFARVRATRHESLDLVTVAKAAVRMVQAHSDCPATADVRVEGEPTMLEGDEDLLHRVVANLVLNAVQAARAQAVHVTVRVSGIPLAELPHGADFERAVRLQVEDDGPGIPDEIRERIFEPFVSGRPGGSGLGLAIVQRAVDAHRGLVYVDSKLRVGTTFTILLPASALAEEFA